MAGRCIQGCFFTINEYKGLIDFFTVNDNNHIQMIVKKKNHEAVFEIPLQETLELYDNPKFVNELKNGIPRSWNCCSMEEAIINLEKSNY